MNQTFVDVVILGGGLAGLTLALQLKKESNLEVLVLERREHPAPEAAFKVGESTVELAAHYLKNTLGLGEHLEKHQLPKFGLRFFFGSGCQQLDQRLEIGFRELPPTPSFQLDRGIFENFLAEEVQNHGAVFYSECRVKEVTLGSGQELHRVTYEKDKVKHQIQARWVVDASGRAAILKRKLNLQKDFDHNTNAAWFRIGKKINIDSWGNSETWNNHLAPGTSRWLSTNHMMGAGYWVWIIPLSSGSTSVGIVADAELHPLDKYNSFEKSLQWLQKFEPQVASAVAENRDHLQDFLAMRHYAHDCQQVFSDQRWALTGEAGVFLDPFYSPGSDFIAQSNCFITDLILRDNAGENIAERSHLLNQLYLRIARDTLRAYSGQYPLFGHTQVMPLKIVWDYATYWTYPAFLFAHGFTGDLAMLGKIGMRLQQASVLNARMQQFFLAWNNLAEPIARQDSVDLFTIPLLERLNRELRASFDATAFEKQLIENSNELERLSVEIITRASNDHEELKRFLPDEIIEIDRSWHLQPQILEGFYTTLFGK